MLIGNFSLFLPLSMLLLQYYFNPSLFHLSSFNLSYVAVSRPFCRPEFYCNRASFLGKNSLVEIWPYPGLNSLPFKSQ